MGKTQSVEKWCLKSASYCKMKQWAKSYFYANILKSFSFYILENCLWYHGNVNINIKVRVKNVQFLAVCGHSDSVQLLLDHTCKQLSALVAKGQDREQPQNSCVLLCYSRGFLTGMTGYRGPDSAFNEELYVRDFCGFSRVAKSRESF